MPLPSSAMRISQSVGHKALHEQNSDMFAMADMQFWTRSMICNAISGMVYALNFFDNPRNIFRHGGQTPDRRSSVTGARPQQPRQRVASSVNRPSLCCASWATPRTFSSSSRIFCEFLHNMRCQDIRRRHAGPWLQSKLRIESGHAIDIRHGDPHFIGYQLLNIKGQAPENILRLLHYWHQRPWSIFFS